MTTVQIARRSFLASAIGFGALPFPDAASLLKPPTMAHQAY